MCCMYLFYRYVDVDVHLKGTYPSLEAELALSQPRTSRGLSRIRPPCRPEKSIATYTLDRVLS